MRYTLKTMIVPVCIVVMLGTQLFDYFANGHFNGMFIPIVCFLTPSAIKGLKPEFEKTNTFKHLSNTLLIVGIVIMVLVILW